MICTKEEADKKWCPMAQMVYIASYGALTNRDDFGATTVCLGPNCMAWAWITPDNTKGRCGLVGRV